MKTIVTFAFILISTLLFSQNNFKVIVKDEKSVLSKGTINEVPITLFLSKKEKISYCDLYDTFIEGWYYYDKYKVKIPLYGFSRDCEIKVYNFSKSHPSINQGESDSVIDSIYENSKYNESLKFFYCESGVKGIFTKNNKTSKILINSDKIIGEDYEFFILPNSKKLNLAAIFKGLGNKFISLKQDKTENRVIFYFQFPSNRNACRMCGASEGEKGYRIIYFDKNWEIKKKQEYLIESCLESISNIKKVKSKSIIMYSIKKDTEDKFPQLLNVDTVNSMIIKSK